MIDEDVDSFKELQQESGIWTADKTVNIKDGERKRMKLSLQLHKKT